MNMTTATLLEGNCLDHLRTMADESVHAIITDPPYGLANTDPAHVVEALTKWATGDREFIPEGRGFMGKVWDAFVPPPAVWDECLRVLKPGGHLLAFAGSRTFDLMALSIRFAGFDIRDSIAWLYGSGFPKSMDVSKAIDRARNDVGDWRVVGAWLKAQREAAGFTRQSIAPLLSDHRNLESAAANMSNWENGLGFPTLKRWDELRGLLHFNTEMDAEVLRLNIRKGEPGDAWAGRGVMTEIVGTSNSLSGPVTRTLNHGVAQLDEAREWQGWGTALKPAFEPIVVARKPFPGTVAANVLVHKTGALNIDGTRIEGERWPANVMLDDSQAAAFEESRFFYVAKAPKAERPVVDGEAHPTVKPLALMRQLIKLVTPPGGIVVDPFAGSGTTLEAAHLEGFDSIGIEMTETYWPLIRHRIKRAKEAASAKTSADDEALFSWDETA